MRQMPLRCKIKDRLRAQDDGRRDSTLPGRLCNLTLRQDDMLGRWLRAGDGGLRVRGDDRP
jgi:hypothetical protein